MSQFSNTGLTTVFDKEFKQDIDKCVYMILYFLSFYPQDQIKIMSSRKKLCGNGVSRKWELVLQQPISASIWSLALWIFSKVKAIREGVQLKKDSKHK